MKKLILVSFLCISVYLSTSMNSEVVIPKESIRFRLIANSNSLEDQLQKQTLKEEIESTYLSDLSGTSLEETRQNIIKNIPTLEEFLSSRVDTYEIHYGFNLFPEKTYKGITYPSGNYESLVITLGNGLGDNYWCVLYPPLCQIDNVSDIEYKSLVQEMIGNL